MHLLEISAFDVGIEGYVIAIREYWLCGGG